MAVTIRGRGRTGLEFDMSQDTCCAPECNEAVPPSIGRGRPRKYCSKRCAKRVDNASLSNRLANEAWKMRTRANAEYRADEAEQRRARRERDRLDPEKRQREIERQRRKREKSRRTSLSGWREVANDLPRQIDTEMDRLERRLRLADCDWCGSTFLASRPDTAYCSESCNRRMKRMRRRAREFAATGTYTWMEVVRVYAVIGRVCAYCHEHFPLSEIEPDHVVALSVGGANSITNIVPSCQLCNADKRHLSLDEWARDRGRRGVEPRSLHPQISHLTSLMLVS